MRKDAAPLTMAPEKGRYGVDREAERGAAEVLSVSNAGRPGVLKRGELDTLDALIGPDHAEDLGRGALPTLGMPGQDRHRALSELPHQGPTEVVGVHPRGEIGETPHLVANLRVDGEGELLGEFEVVLDGEHRYEGLEEVDLRDSCVAEDTMQEEPALSRRELGVREGEPLGRGGVISCSREERAEGAATTSIGAREPRSDSLRC